MRQERGCDAGVTTDPQTCDDAAALAQKGLTVPKPAGMSDADWTKFTGLAYPIFHSAIALDDIVSKKDLKSAIEEYNEGIDALSARSVHQAGACLIDTLQLAQTYAKPGDTRDEVKAIWFYARAWDFAPAAYQGTDRTAARVLVQAVSRHAGWRCRNQAADRCHRDAGTGNAVSAGDL